MDAQLLAAELGVVAGVVGACAHRRAGVGAWLPHLVMGGAMGAMALPEHDPLGPGGWMLLLGGAAAWAWGAWGRPGRGRRRAAVALDLYVMGVATLLMPAVHGGGHGSSEAGHAAGESATGWWSGPYAALLVLWALAHVALAVVEQRRRRAEPGGAIVGRASGRACGGALGGGCEGDLGGAREARRTVAAKAAGTRTSGAGAAAAGAVVARRTVAKDSVPSVCSMVMIGAMGVMAFTP